MTDIQNISCAFYTISNLIFRVAVSRSKEVAAFGPPIPEGAIFPKSKKFADFLLAKGK